jgi:hypothetical protein
MKIYVFDNELIKEGDDDLTGALIDEHEAWSDVECLQWFEENYGSNDFTCSFTAP